MIAPFYSIPIPLSINVLRRISHFNPLIVNYHVVSDKRLPYIEYLYKYRDIRTFKDDIDFLMRKFNPINLPVLLDHLKSGTRLPDNSFLLTFDDGFREVVDIVLPFLLKKKLTATFFLTTAFLDNKELGYMNKKSVIIDHLNKSVKTNDHGKLTDFLKISNITGSTLEKSILGIQYKKRHLLDEIAKILHLNFEDVLQQYQPYLTSHQVNMLLKEGMSIGSHSIDHARFSELSLEEQVFQSVSSTKFIHDKFNVDYKVFAFPYTDKSISRNFFNETADFFDATFGTQGLIVDCIKNNLQRVNLEKFSYSAERTLKSLYSRRIYYNVFGMNRIFRNNK